MKGWDFPAAADAAGLTTTWRASLSKAIGPLWWTAWAVTLLAAVWPSRPADDQRQPVDGIVLTLAVDRSGSMRRTDAGDRTRLDVVADVAAEFLTGNPNLLDDDERLAAGSARPDDRIGLVSFAAVARTEVSPSLDHDLVAGRLAAIETAEGVREDGTAIGDAIALSVANIEEAVGPQSENPVGRVVLLLTDGQHNAGRLSPVVAAEAAALRGVRVYVVSVRPDGASDAVWAESDRQLRGVAERTGGQWFRAGNAEALRAVTAEIDRLERRDQGPPRRPATESWAVDRRPIGAIPVPPLAAVAVALLVTACVLRDAVCRPVGGGT